MALNKATKKFFQDFCEILQKNPPKPLSQTTMEEYRKGGESLFGPLAGAPAAVPFENKVITGAHGNHIEITIFNSKTLGLLPALIFYPGGGFIADLNVHHVPCSRIAEQSNCRVILVRTRLAPEHPFPAGFEDALDAYQWIQKNALQLNIDSKKIMVAGDSSGGNFAALVAITARDKKLPLAHQFLISPATDLSRSITGYEQYEKEDILLSPELAKWAYAKYLPQGIFFKDPKVSPYWHPNLTGVAASTIIVAEHDGIRADSEGYAEKLRLAGNNCELIVCKGQVHSFMIARAVLNEGEDPVDLIAQKIKAIFYNL
jgi:acetyl esterase